MKSVWTVPTLQAQEEALTAQEVKRRRRQRGFTLIEMLAVVIILAIVAGVGFVVVNNQIENSRVRADIANLRTIADAAQRYLMDHPNDHLQQLNTLQSNGYLGNVPNDPWGAGGNYSIDAQITNGNISISVTGPHSFGTNLPSDYTNAGITNNNGTPVLRIPSTTQSSQQGT